jgi:hypothetical protein
VDPNYTTVGGGSDGDSIWQRRIDWCPEIGDILMSFVLDGYNLDFEVAWRF